MAHILSSIMFSLIALVAAGAIAATLVQARVAIATALGIALPARVRRYRAPVRVTIRRTAAWPVPRRMARHAA